MGTTNFYISLRVSLEAGVAQGWTDVLGLEGKIISIDRFGESAPAARIAEHLGFTARAVSERLKPLLG